jgi:CheY-like chemotaxis protein
VNAKTIVIVDDEPGAAETLREVFEDEGYAVETSHDGRDGLALLNALAQRPCLVILDLVMPVLDGVAMYAAMKADPSLADISVMITTSDPSLAPSGVLIMKKPLNLGILIDNVRKCCGTPVRATGL